MTIDTFVETSRPRQDVMDRWHTTGHIGGHTTGHIGGGIVGDIDSAVATLPAVSLDEMVQRAELQTRVDRKYLVDRALLRALIGQTAGGSAALQIDGRRAFDYRSVYFDTPDLVCFRDHRQGRRRRFKVRSRLYVDSGLGMLEVKTKGMRSATVKHRREWPAATVDGLNADGRAFVAGVLHDIAPGAGAGVDADADPATGSPAARLAASLVPSLTTDYRRITLLDVAAGSRATIDLDLVFSAGRTTVAAPVDTVIVETKSANGAGRVDRQLSRWGVRPVSVSKYCTGIALTRPGLAANPWQRTLRRFFRP